MTELADMIPLPSLGTMPMTDSDEAYTARVGGIRERLGDCLDRNGLLQSMYQRRHHVAVISHRQEDDRYYLHKIAEWVSGES